MKPESRIPNGRARPAIESGVSSFVILLTFDIRHSGFSMPLSQAAPGESSTVTRNYRHMRGQEFFVLTRRERRAYPSAVCKERATRSARKRAAALWVAPHWAWGVVA